MKTMKMEMANRRSLCNSPILRKSFKEIKKSLNRDKITINLANNRTNKIINNRRKKKTHFVQPTQYVMKMVNPKIVSAPLVFNFVSVVYHKPKPS